MILRGALVLGVLAGLLVAGCHRRPSVSDIPSPPPTAEPAPSEDPVSSPRVAGSPTPPQLLEGVQSVDAAVLAADLGRAETLVSHLQELKLSENATHHLLDAAAFVEKAREALESGDAQRAALLLDKARVLLQQVESSAPPPKR